MVQVHIIIADQKMPNMTGVEFLEEANQRPEPIKIVVTAHRDTSAIEKAYKEGKIFKFHYKPWNIDTFEKTIEDACKEFNQRLNKPT